MQTPGCAHAPDRDQDTRIANYGDTAASNASTNCRRRGMFQTDLGFNWSDSSLLVFWTKSFEPHLIRIRSLVQVIEKEL